MSIANLINGINPSIAKLVYYLNFWGIETYSSHAGFYPGDPEEQEYWIQKDGYESEMGSEINGPIVLYGDIWFGPYVHGWIQNKNMDLFIQLLPQYWEIREDNRIINRSQSHTPIKIEYKHPKLIEFKRISDSLFDEIEEKLGNPEYYKYTNDEIIEINGIITKRLPLNKEELISIRDQGIKELENTIIQDILTFDDERIKYLVDKITGSKNYYDTTPRAKSINN